LSAIGPNKRDQGTFPELARLVIMSEADRLRAKAAECRELAANALDSVAGHLLMLAAEYEAEAEKLEDPGPRPDPRPES
jgi:hypothetical protein